MVHNRGIAHASHRKGGLPFCRNDRAHYSTDVESFRKEPLQCKRCAAKVAKMDTKRSRPRTTRQLAEILGFYTGKIRLDHSTIVCALIWQDEAKTRDGRLMANGFFDEAVKNGFVDC